MSDDQYHPIGMLDSGLGGLTVLLHASQLLPKENFIYYADLKHSPYGKKNREQLIPILEQGVDYLLRQGMKVLVFASNTATSAAVEVFRARLKIPVVGIEPALKPAVQITRQGKILVLATELTLKEEKFHKLYEKYHGPSAIILKHCPGLVEMIDEGRQDDKGYDRYFTGLFQELQSEPIAAVVLGCTHYILVKKEISKHFPGAVCLDGNEGVAKQIANVLEKNQLLNPSPQAGKIVFISSDPSRTAWLEERYRKLSS